MCLVLFSFQPSSPQPLVVAANRDEFYARPTQPAHYWQDNPNIFAGRDITAGGTWLGVTRSGRFAALTNFSAGDPLREHPASRGELVTNFLESTAPAGKYLDTLSHSQYAGFNLLLFDGEEMHYTTNKNFPNQRLTAGTYGLSNVQLSEPWPKTVDGAAALDAALSMSGGRQTNLLAVLGDATPPADERLPQRAHLSEAPLETRRAMAARFIAGEDYGTRAKTLVTFNQQHIDVYEQQFGPQGAHGTAVFSRVPRQSTAKPT